MHMQLPTRRLLAVILSLSGLVLLGSGPLDALLQPPPAAAPVQEKEEPDLGHNVKLAVDPRARRKVQEARRLIAQQEWSQAIRLLQSLLDSKEDSFLPDDTNKRYVSIRAESNRLLGSLPREGRQFYELEFGSQAKALLARARELGDPRTLGDVAVRFQHTEAGAEAAALLGSYYLDQSQFIVAALWFERLMSREDAASLVTPLLLLKASLAFERANMPDQRNKAFESFLARVDQPGAPPLPAPLRGRSAEQWQALLVSTDVPKIGQTDWLMLQGRDDRAGQAVGEAPFLEPRTGFPVDVTRPLKMTSIFNHDGARRLLEDACKSQARFNQPILSGHHPVGVGDLLIYRGAWGLHAFNLRTGALAWEHPLQASLAAMTSAAPAAGLDMQRTPVEASSVLFENSMIGVLSSDRQFVYAIEDLAVPEMPVTRMSGPRGAADRQGKWAFHNELVAYDLKEGLPAWVIGTYEPDQPFSDCFFLGAPLPLGDKLYVLVEIAGEIRLMCLENRRIWDAAANRHRSAAEVIWSQALCQVNRRLPDDPGRRLHAALLSYGDGTLICPTNAGVVLGVDLLTCSLLWAHAYQVQDEAPREPGMGMPAGVPIIRRGRVVMGEGPAQPLGQNTWAVAAPIVHRGYVIFTAPDAKGLHVLNLRDGTLAWRRDRQTGQGAADLYLAGVDGDHVLLVGHKSIKALSLSKQGQVMWETPLTGLPSGRGILSKGLYYLPLRTAEPRDKAGGEIWTIDVQTGAVVTRNRVRHEVPGNLIFLAGDLASQNVLRLSVFPQLANKEREITERLTANPRDPMGLAQRGELKIHRGELKEGVADLRAGLAGEWADETERRRAREKLFDALCDLVERKFAEHEADLEELANLADLPAPTNEPPEAKQKRLEEVTDRRARVVRLVGRGREAQGRLVDALKSYLDFVPPTPTLLQSPEDPAVQIAPQRWVQARVRELFLRAKPPQHADLLAVVNERWSMVRAGDLEQLRRFAEQFGPLLPVGRDALLLLADKLIDQGDFAQARLQLLHLLQLLQDASPATAEDDRHAARALDALARLNLKQNLLEDAAFYFKKLATLYPNVPVRDGKTGQELYLELTTDKRFLPFLSQRDLPRRGLLAQPYAEIARLPSAAATSSAGQGRFWATFVGDVTPLFQRHRLGIDPALRQARFIDVNTEADRGGFPMEQIPTGFYSPAYTVDGAARPSVPAHALGQLVLFNWANHVYAYDLVEGKRRWRIDLLAPTDAAGPDRATSLVPGPNGRFMILHASRNFMEPVGTLGPVTPHHAVLITKAGLRVIDPLTQQARWTRDDITPDAEVIGDHQLLLLHLPSAREGKRAIALNMNDGSIVEGIDVLKLFQTRVQTLGRRVLLWDEAADDCTLRLFDPLLGRDVWKWRAGPKSVLVRSHHPDTVAVVEQDGTLQALDLATGQKLFTTKLDAKNIADAKQIFLLADALHWYIAFSIAADQPNQGMRFVATYNMSVLRTLPVQGPLVAIDRVTAERRWEVDLPQQGLIIEQFEELPLVLCASFREVRVGQGPNNPGNYRYVSTLLALDKRDGRVIDKTESPNGSQYSALRVDAAAGRIELLGHPLKAGFQLRGD